jgi:hypothetical protein
VTFTAPCPPAKWIDASKAGKRYGVRLKRHKKFQNSKNEPLHEIAAGVRLDWQLVLAVKNT